MSVDCSACLGYGWIVEHGDLTDRFHELCDDDFAEFDDRFFGYGYAHELVTALDGYSERSAYHIGLPIETQKRIYVNDRLVGFTDVDALEFSDMCASFVDKENELIELYEAVMGEKPKNRPSVNLFACWW